MTIKIRDKNERQLRNTFLFLFRKYEATICQISDLNSNEIKWLANYLGHNVDIHQEYYRLHDNAIELAKVSCLLLVVDSDKGEAFKDKRLSEKQVDGKFICLCSLLGLDCDYHL